MRRALWFASAASAISLAAFVVLAIPLTASAQRQSFAQRQYADEDINVVWHCSKCDGMVGSGPHPPNFCPHCKTPLCSLTDFEDDDEPAVAKPQAKSRGASGESGPLEKMIVGAVVILALACLGYIVYGNSGEE